MIAETTRSFLVADYFFFRNKFAGFYPTPQEQSITVVFMALCTFVKQRLFIKEWLNAWRAMQVLGTEGCTRLCSHSAQIRRCFSFNSWRPPFSTQWWHQTSMKNVTEKKGGPSHSEGGPTNRFPRTISSQKWLRRAQHEACLITAASSIPASFQAWLSFLQSATKSTRDINRPMLVRFRTKMVYKGHTMSNKQGHTKIKG